MAPSANSASGHEAISSARAVITEKKTYAVKRARACRRHRSHATTGATTADGHQPTVSATMAYTMSATGSAIDTR